MWHKIGRFNLIAIVAFILLAPVQVTQLASASDHLPVAPGVHFATGAISWNKLEPGWAMFHGGSGVNGSYSGYFPWSHFGVAWENSFPNTSYSPQNSAGVSPQSSPVVFNGNVYMMASATPSLLQVNATTGNLVNSVNFGSVTGTTATASIVSTPLIGEYNDTPWLTVNVNAAGTHYSYSMNLSSGAVVYCHSALASTGSSAPLPGGFVEPTRNGALLFSSWALGNNAAAHCTNVATEPSTDVFYDTPSIGLTYYPPAPTAPNVTFFLSDQSTNSIDGFSTAGGALWADKLDAVANSSLALSNTSYATTTAGSPVNGPIGFIADDGGAIGPSHLYAIDVNCGVRYCFSDANTSNTLPGGTLALPPAPPTIDGGVNSTVALRAVAPNATQVIYASRDGTLAAVTATVEGQSAAGPYSMNGYSVNWTKDWAFPTGANITASPVTANGLVMEGNDAGMFYILNASTGALVWEHQLPGAICSSPALYNGQIYVLTMNGTLVDIGPSSPITSLEVAPMVTDDFPTPVNVTVNSTGPTGLSSGPLANAAVTLLVSGGMYSGSTVLGTVDTLGDGVSTFSWTPPDASTNHTYNFTAFVNATGYSTANATGSTLAIPPPPLIISAIGASPSRFTVGHSTFINVTASGGFSPYTYVYTALPPGCTTQNVPSLLCTPDTAGNYSVAVNVRDPAGAFATASTPVNVTPAIITPPLLISSFTAVPGIITLGNSTTLTSVVTGGVTPYSYAYSSLPTGCVTANTSTLSCKPTASGSFDISLQVTDPAGKSATGSVRLSVYSYPAIESFVAAPSILTLGSETNITVQVINGAPPFTYQFGGLPTGCATSNVSVLKCIPIQTGNYSVSVKVTDVHMLSASGTTRLQVKPAVVVPLIASLAANPNPVVAGNSTVFTTTVSGGTLPYAFSYSGLPNGCASNNSAMLACVPRGAGTFNVTVIITDAKGSVAKGTLSLVVTEAPSITSSKGGFLSSITSFDWMIIALAAVVVLLVLLAVYLGRRKKPTQPAAPVEDATPAAVPAVAEVKVATDASPPPSSVPGASAAPPEPATPPPLPNEPEWSEDK